VNRNWHDTILLYCYTDILMNCQTVKEEGKGGRLFVKFG